MKFLSILFVILMGTTAWAQDSLENPLLNIKSYTTFDIGIYDSRVNTTNVDFEDYTLIKGRHYPTIHSAFYWNSVVSSLKTEDLFIFKTGLLIESYRTDLVDQQGKEWSFGQSILNLPLIVGWRLPINYNNPKSRYFKAVDINIGMLFGVPVFERIIEKNDYDAQTGYYNFNYLKFGTIAEIVYTSINRRGYGHTVGLRTIVNWKDIWKFKDTEYGVYPTFVSIGLFYNFWTTSVTRRK